MADDAELQLFRSSVNCAAVLEGMVGGWRLDVRESTRRALKYRCGKGEVLIVTHDGAAGGTRSARRRATSSTSSSISTAA